MTYNRLLLGISILLMTHSLLVGAIKMTDLYKLQDPIALKAIITELENLPDYPNNLDRNKTLGIAYHNLAVQNTPLASEKSERYLAVYSSKAPTDNIALAFLGSATTMAARDSWNFFTKLAEVNRGLSLLDLAVNQDASNIVIRLIRAHNSLNLPEFLHRKALVKHDFQTAEKLIPQAKSKLDPDTEANIYYQLGLIAKSDAQTTLANTYFNKAIATSPKTTAGIAAKKEL